MLNINKSQLYFYFVFFVIGILLIAYGTISYQQLPPYHDIGKKHILNSPEIAKEFNGLYRVSDGNTVSIEGSDVTVEYIIDGVGSKKVLLFFSKQADSGQWEVYKYEIP